MGSKKFRKVEVSFWQDGFVINLTPEEKYFYLYLFTNSKTNQLGCYEIPIKLIEMETGYNKETVAKLIERFSEYDKIRYNSENSELLILNWHKFNWSNSPKVKTCILEDLAEIKTKYFITYIQKIMVQMHYIAPPDAPVQKSANVCNEPLGNTGKTAVQGENEYSMDTVSIEWGEEQEQEQEQYICANDCTGAPSGQSVEELFERFYGAYPKKRNRMKALQAFRKLKPTEDLLLMMLVALSAWKQSAEWQKDDGQFIPLPSSWLNGRRWEDDIKVSMPKDLPAPKAQSQTDVLEQRRKAFMAGDDD